MTVTWVIEYGSGVPIAIGTTLLQTLYYKNTDLVMSSEARHLMGCALIFKETVLKD
jgi:hypothetical protein